MHAHRIVLVACGLLLGAAGLHAADRDAYVEKRAKVFEFAAAPTVTRAGDAVTVSFEAKAACDATVCIEDASGRILRHLASGLLGENAPPPFAKGALKQALVWDGKDDAGHYVDNKEACTVRVSLGLKANFERNLFHHPKKRVGMLRNGSICAQPEGVYVYQGAGVEMVRLYGHDGKYLRTVYPFPADKIKDVKGLEWKTGFDGFEFPQKQGYWRPTLLSGGTGDGHHWGSAATSLAVANGRVAVCGDRLSRFATDGTSGGMNVLGPQLGIVLHAGREKFMFDPFAAALSPDGKTLYTTGYYVNTRPLGGPILIPDIKWRHGLFRMDLASDKEPELWLGRAEADDKNEKDNKSDTGLYMPAGVCCDGEGNVYVADFYNDRVQVYSPERKLLKSIPVEGPSTVQVHHKTGELYVFSWAQANRWVKLNPIKPMLRVFASWKDPKKTAEYPLPLHGWGEQPRWMAEVPVRAAVDTWTEPPTVWLMPGWPNDDEEQETLLSTGIKLYRPMAGKLELAQSFHQEVHEAIHRARPPEFQRQRLYVDPRNGMLYIGEGDGNNNMTFSNLVQVDPETGRCAIKKMPYNTEDMVIDTEGLAYLRTSFEVGRFVFDSWREVPFDYGEEVTPDFGAQKQLIGGLALPSNKPVYWHQSGLDVTPTGDIVVHCYNAKNTREKSQFEGGYKHRDVLPTGKPYTPRLYPGRLAHSEVHVWDKHGQVRFQDVIQGLPGGHGTAIDAHGDVYVLAEVHRLIDGKEAYGENAGTLMKFKVGQGKLFAGRGKGCPVPLDEKSKPAGLPSAASEQMGPVWVEGAEWLYGGLGVARPGAPCQCWNTRFDLDGFGRSFAPETDRCQVAVLDSNGNLLLRIGRYGNVDSAGPQSALPLGGDEVGLVYAVYVATHTDRRLFVADPGNGRICGIKLGYHAEGRVALKDVPDKAE